MNRGELFAAAQESWNSVEEGYCTREEWHCTGEEWQEEDDKAEEDAPPRGNLNSRSLTHMWRGFQKIL